MTAREDIMRMARREALELLAGSPPQSSSYLVDCIRVDRFDADALDAADWLKINNLEAYQIVMSWFEAEPDAAEALSHLVVARAIAAADRDVARRRLSWCHAILSNPDAIGLDCEGVARIDRMRLVYEAILRGK